VKPFRPHRSLLQVVGGAQETRDLFLAEHDRKLLCLTPAGMSSSTIRGRLSVAVKKNRSAETATMIELSVPPAVLRFYTVRTPIVG
jgi:hypothetical protein